MSCLAGCDRSPADERFPVHSELIIALPAIAPLHKFSDNDVCAVTRIGPGRPGLPVWYFSEKKWRCGCESVREVSVWHYRPTSSHGNDIMLARCQPPMYSVLCVCLRLMRFSSLSKISQRIVEA